MSLIEGVELKPLVRHVDERGFFEEILRVEDIVKFGQLSHSMMVAGTVKAWHIHQKQTDYWYVPIGALKVVLCDRRTNSSTYGQIKPLIMGYNAETLTIPPGVAHGCAVLQSPCHLFYVTSEMYDVKNPDEGRIAYDSPNIPYDWLQRSEIK